VKGITWKNWGEVSNMLLQDVECVVLGCTDFVAYRDLWQALVNVLMNVQVL
jgi:glutamate racemase